jgi:transcriptional regulator with XRE-family HTH domain
VVDTTVIGPIGTLIRELRHRRALSQQALAHRLATVSGNDGITRGQVARWEHGTRIPSPYWRRWIGSVLDIPVPSLDTAAAYTQFLRAVPDLADANPFLPTQPGPGQSS